MKKLEITNHHQEFYRPETGLSFEGTESLTDQSFKNDCDINIIMKNFAKTGVLPQQTNLGDYIDATEIPTLEQAFDISRRASEAFLSLPAEVRNLINHDPSQLEKIVSNPEYRDILKKHGVINIMDEVKAPEVKTDKVEGNEKDAI